MSDLSSLMQIAPVTAAGMIGANNQQELLIQQIKQKMQEAELASSIQKQQFDAQNNPLLLDQQRNKNLYDTSVRLPEGQQDLQTKTLANQFTGATQGTKIQSTNAANLDSVDKDKQSARDRFQQYLLKTSAQLENVPPAMRMNALLSDMKQNGFDPSQTPIVMNWLAQSGNGENLPKHMIATADRLGKLAASQDTHYLGTTDSAKIHGEYGVKQHEISAGATIGAARIAADAKTRVQEMKDTQNKAGDLLAMAKSGKITYEKAATAFTIEAMQEQDVEKRAQLTAYAKFFGDESLKAKAAASGGKIDPTSISPDFKTQAAPEAGSVPAPLSRDSTASKPVAPTGKTSSGASYTIIKQ